MAHDRPSAALCADVSNMDVSYVKTMMNELKTLRAEKEFTDVTLSAGDLDIPCHKAVLSAATPYFKAMFTQKMKESTAPVVELKSMDAATLQSVVDYIYSGSIELREDNVEELLQAGDMLLLVSLTRKCEAFMKENLRPQNCIIFYLCGNLYNLQEVRDLALDMMLEDLGRVMECQEFLEMSKKELENYLSSDCLVVNSEDCVLDAVIKWICHDIEDRSKQSKTVFEKCVRLAFCSTGKLVQSAQLDFIVSNTECSKLLLAGLDVGVNSSFPSASGLIPDLCFHPRKCYTKPDIILQCSNLAQDKRSISVYHSLKGGNAYREFLGEHKLNIGPSCQWTLCSKGILITGGWSTKYRQMQQVHLLSYDGQSCTEVEHLNEGRHSHSSVLHKSCVYVIGGLDVNDEPLDSVERYDCNAMKWFEVRALPEKLCDTLPFSHPASGQLFVAGGRYHSTDLFDISYASVQVYAYDSSWNTWKEKTSMPVPFCHMTGYLHGDKIYLLGTLYPPDEAVVVLCYDISKDAWTEIVRKTDAITEDMFGLFRAQTWGSVLHLIMKDTDLEWQFDCMLQDKGIVEVQDACSECAASNSRRHLFECVQFTNMWNFSSSKND